MQLSCQTVKINFKFCLFTKSQCKYITFFYKNKKNRDFFLYSLKCFIPPSYSANESYPSSQSLPNNAIIKSPHILLMGMPVKIPHDFHIHSIRVETVMVMTLKLPLLDALTRHIFHSKHILYMSLLLSLLY